MDPEKPFTNSVDVADIKLASTQLGVWRILLEDKPALSWVSLLDPRTAFSAVRETFPLVKRLASDIYALESTLLFVYLFSKVWSGIESALLLYLSSRLLNLIELGLREGKPQVSAIVIAAVARLACVAIAAIVRWWKDDSLPRLTARITTHFEIILMKAKLKIDLVGGPEPTKSSRTSGENAWSGFEAVVDFAEQLLMLFSQLAFIIEASRSTGGPFFALLCIARPLLSNMSERSLWTRPCVVSSNHKSYQRIQALKAMSSNEYRQDVVSGNLGDYIIKEYHKAAEELGETSSEWAEAQYSRDKSPSWPVICDIAGDLPMVYCAAVAILNPVKFTLASVAILQQSSTVLRYTLDGLLYSTSTFRRRVLEVKNMYAAASPISKLDDGAYEYPNRGIDLVDEKLDNGMGFELKDVVFSYPASKTTTPALNGVTLSIRPGSLVVVVGKNGSGKSTIIKILSRLYDVSSGSLLLDNRPIKDYRIATLREATAHLTQDHHLYPLSLKENIGLGCAGTAFEADSNTIQEAMKSGGAWDCVKKFEEGVETILDPMTETYSMNLEAENEDHPLVKEQAKASKTVDVSGGERQRLVAARTFMRFNTGKVRFVAVDEPSSALDPDGEQALFQNLRDLRTNHGKCTMVFVTHRFGHLTKYADQIIVMKDGKVAQTGKHEQLMALDGEYKSLYDIQANAFITDVPTEDA